jgi:hypothetical protein
LYSHGFLQYEISITLRTRKTRSDYLFETMGARDVASLFPTVAFYVAETKRGVPYAKVAGQTEFQLSRTKQKAEEGAAQK